MVDDDMAASRHSHAADDRRSGIPRVMDTGSRSGIRCFARGLPRSDDPVLASDVQVGPPQTGEEDEVRFALTSEAGHNLPARIWLRFR